MLGLWWWDVLLWLCWWVLFRKWGMLEGWAKWRKERSYDILVSLLYFFGFAHDCYDDESLIKLINFFILFRKYSKQFKLILLSIKNY